MTKEKMNEAEVDLYIANYYIKNNLTNNDVLVSIDGAHIKTKEVIHFDIKNFLKNLGFTKTDADLERWQGEYKLSDDLPKLIIHSKHGIGDVNIRMKDGTEIYVESKKGTLKNKNSQEYSLMREAIGQLITSKEMNENIIPMVAVPFSPKSYELACKWSEYTQIKLLRINFMLVHEDGDITMVNFKSNEL
ncbi:hypothetical protein JK636_18980 [Clostridium sp. YIM B02515]|uniref:Restriction endonuclease n=1 Tax=Clostridium rhizosphaerae TaxID=2803861 RepID=A0ABS1TEJ3_9CLOT|nr:hypothetical protein [Clostridium rhizosphaerae]MBL4937794.1 hypothetical protein [Clostridium rhizosphaerae]